MTSRGQILSSQGATHLRPQGSCLPNDRIRSVRPILSVSVTHLVPAGAEMGRS